MPRRIKVLKNRGTSWVEWVMIFAVVVAVFSLFTSMYRREIKNKIQATGDYLLWTSWGTPVAEKDALHQKEVQSAASSKSIAKSAQWQENRVIENRGLINNDSNVSVRENNASVSVEEGAQSELKTFNLNDKVALPVIPAD